MLHNKHTLLLAIVFAVGGSVSTMAQYAVPVGVVSSGASRMVGSQYSLMGTVGQAAIGVTANSTYADSQGFWYCVGPAAALAIGNPGLTLPASFSLAQNYPNPFNPATEIRFQVPATSRVTIKVFNIAGQLVETLADQNFNSGEHVLRWNADRHATGIYLVRMSAPGFTEIRRAVLLK